MSVNDKTYWEVCIEINPVCADVLCDIIQTEFECEGIITAEETYKNLELVKSTEDILKAYIVADILNFDEIQSFFKTKKSFRKSFNIPTIHIYIEKACPQNITTSFLYKLFPKKDPIRIFLGIFYDTFYSSVKFRLTLFIPQKVGTF